MYVSFFMCFQPIKKKKALGSSKKVAPAPLAVKKVEPKKIVNPLFEKRPKNFGIGKFYTKNQIGYCYSKVLFQSQSLQKKIRIFIDLLTHVKHAEHVHHHTIQINNNLFLFLVQVKISNQNVTYHVSYAGQNMFAFNVKRPFCKNV